MKIIVAMIKPIIAESVNLIFRLMISRLKPIEPVRFLFNTDKAGIKLAINVPDADPRIAPIIKKAIKNPKFFLSKVIAYIAQPLLSGCCLCQDI